MCAKTLFLRKFELKLKFQCCQTQHFSTSVTDMDN